MTVSELSKILLCNTPDFEYHGKWYTIDWMLRHRLRTASARRYSQEWIAYDFEGIYRNLEL